VRFADSLVYLLAILHVLSRGTIDLWVKNFETTARPRPKREVVLPPTGSKKTRRTEENVDSLTCQTLTMCG